MMSAAKRDRELVADFLPEPTWLGVAQVMGVRGLAAANETGLFRNES
jgi:hypothetical protein